MTPNKITSDQRRTLEEEYKIAYQYFNDSSNLAWSTFSYVSGLNVAALAFVSQFSFSNNRTANWFSNAIIAISLIIILVSWLGLANRWWAYGQVSLRRMTQIEDLLGMYLMTESGWLRAPLKEDQLDLLSKENLNRYDIVRKTYPRFPKYNLRSQVLASYMIRLLIVIWVIFLIASFLH